MITKVLGCDTEVIRTRSWSTQVCRWVKMIADVYACYAWAVNVCVSSAGWMQQHLGISSEPSTWARHQMLQEGNSWCGSDPGTTLTVCPGHRWHNLPLFLPVSSALTDVWHARQHNPCLQRTELDYQLRVFQNNTGSDRLCHFYMTEKTAAQLLPCNKLPYCETSLWIRYSEDKS